jgi:beta-glucosidase
MPSTTKISNKKTSAPAYRNPALPAARRTKDLLSRMTLEEKAAQMICIWREKPDTLVDADGKFDLAKARKAFKDRRGLGQVGRPSEAGKGLRREFPPGHSGHIS